MKALLICPAARENVAALAETAPLSNLPAFGRSLIECWLGHLSVLGAREIFVLATDRPEQVRALIGDGRTVRPVVLHAIATAGTPAAVGVVSGDAQHGAPSTATSKPIVLRVSTAAEFDGAFASLGAEKANALIVTADGIFTDGREQLAALALRYRVPAIYQWGEFVRSGGLIS